MSAELAIRAALLTAVQGDGALMALLNGAYDGPPVKASAPYAVVGECIGTDWGTKDGDGREVRIGLTLVDRGETPGALAGMLVLADAAARRIDGAVAGWDVASIAFLRSRIVRARETGWSAVLDYRVRVVRA